MIDRSMSDTPVDQSARAETAPARNKGQQLIESFRLARLAARPALRTELQGCRTALKQQRLQRNGQGSAPAITPHDAGAAVPGAPESVSETAAESDAGASVFAAFCVSAEMPAPEESQAVDPDTVPDERPETPAPTVPRAVVSLAAIGFGPGMVIRMSQLGIETADDLAAADATWLQSALGDLSELVHADRWIASAKAACGD